MVNSGLGHNKFLFLPYNTHYSKSLSASKWGPTHNAAFWKTLQHTISKNKTLEFSHFPTL